MSLKILETTKRFVKAVLQDVKQFLQGMIKTKQLELEEEIVEDIFNNLHYSTIKHIAQSDNLILLHNTFGLEIRNTYNLWTSTHPLTREWSEDRWDGKENYMKIKDGIKIDNHPCHPDAVSMRIIKKLQVLCKKRLYNDRKE